MGLEVLGGARGSKLQGGAGNLEAKGRSRILGAGSLEKLNGVSEDRAKELGSMGRGLQ